VSFRRLLPFLAFALSILPIAAGAADPVFRSPSELARLPAPVREWYRTETELLYKEQRPGVFNPLEANNQADAFKPQAARIFEIQGYWLPASEMQIYSSGLSPRMRKRFTRIRNGVQEVLFLVHPESERFYAGLGLSGRPHQTVLAAATASSRSLLVWDEHRPHEPFVGKLSLDAVIGNVERTITGKETAMSVGIDRILSGIRPLPEDFAFLHEPMSMIPRGMARGGMILRTFPEGAAASNTLVPLFALAKMPPKGGKPYVLVLAEKAGLSPREFITRELIDRFVEQWVTLAVDYGILMEPHGQNLMLELNRRGKFTGRFVHRDFGGFNIDLRHVRDHFGIDAGGLPKFGSDLFTDYYQADHAKNMAKGLYTYFADGGLYAFQSQWKIWAERGWLGGDTSAFLTKELMIRALTRSLGRRAGRELAPLRPEEIAPLVLRLRDSVVRRNLGPAECRGNLLPPAI
jgi:hypothetical protein